MLILLLKQNLKKIIARTLNPFAKEYFPDIETALKAFLKRCETAITETMTQTTYQRGKFDTCYILLKTVLEVEKKLIEANKERNAAVIRRSKNNLKDIHQSISMQLFSPPEDIDHPLHSSIRCHDYKAVACMRYFTGRSPFIIDKSTELTPEKVIPKDAPHMRELIDGTLSLIDPIIEKEHIKITNQKSIPETPVKTEETSPASKASASEATTNHPDQETPTQLSYADMVKKEPPKKNTKPTSTIQRKLEDTQKNRRQKPKTKGKRPNKNTRKATATVYFKNGAYHQINPTKNSDNPKGSRNTIPKNIFGPQPKQNDLDLKQITLSQAPGVLSYAQVVKGKPLQEPSLTINESSTSSGTLAAEASNTDQSTISEDPYDSDTPPPSESPQEDTSTSPPNKTYAIVVSGSSQTDRRKSQSKSQKKGPSTHPKNSPPEKTQIEPRKPRLPLNALIKECNKVVKNPELEAAFSTKMKNYAHQLGERDKDRNTIGHILAFNNKEDLLLQFLDHCPPESINAKNINNHTMLHFTCYNNMPKATEKLLDLGADPSIKSSKATEEKTAAHLALRAPSTNCLHLLKKAEDKDKQNYCNSKSLRGVLPCHIAFENGSLAAMNFFIDHKDINLWEKCDEFMPLSLLRDKFDREQLPENKEKIESICLNLLQRCVKENDWQHVREIACTATRSHMTTVLSKCLEYPEVIGLLNHGETILTDAIKNNYLLEIPTLTKQIPLLTQKNRDGKTAFQIAQEQACKLALATISSIILDETINDRNINALYTIVFPDDTTPCTEKEKQERLLARLGHIDEDFPFNPIHLPLYCQALSDSVHKTSEPLTRLRKSIFTHLTEESPLSQLPIHALILNQETEIIDKIFQIAPQLTKAKDPHRNTVAHSLLMSQTGPENLLKQITLIEKTLLEDNKDGQCPFELACKNPHAQDLMERLSNKLIQTLRTDLNTIKQSTENKNKLLTQIERALRALLHKETLNDDETALIEEAIKLNRSDKKLNISDKRSHDSHPPLIHILAQFNHHTLIPKFIKNDFSPRKEDANGNTPFMTACRYKQVNVMTVLQGIKRCAIKQKNHAGQTAWHLIARYGNFASVTTLNTVWKIDNSVLHDKDSSRNTLLHLTLQNENKCPQFTKFFDDVYIKGKCLEVANKHNTQEITPAMIQFKMFKVVELMIKAVKNDDVDTVKELEKIYPLKHLLLTPHDITFLDLAIESNANECARYIIQTYKKHPDFIHQRSADKKNAIDRCVLNGNIDILDELLAINPKVTASNADTFNALHQVFSQVALAFRDETDTLPIKINTLYQICQKLLNYGFSPNDPNPAGQSATTMAFNLSKYVSDLLKFYELCLQFNGSTIESNNQTTHYLIAKTQKRKDAIKSIAKHIDHKISEGATEEEINRILYNKTTEPFQPLIYIMAELGLHELAKDHLKNHPEDITKADSQGRTPFHSACEHGHALAFKFLANESTVTKPSRLGITPVMTLIERKDNSAVAWLLETYQPHIIKIAEKNHFGKSAVDMLLASQNHHLLYSIAERLPGHIPENCPESVSPSVFEEVVSMVEKSFWDDTIFPIHDNKSDTHPPTIEEIKSKINSNTLTPEEWILYINAINIEDLSQANETIFHILAKAGAYTELKLLMEYIRDEENLKVDDILSLEVNRKTALEIASDNNYPLLASYIAEIMQSDTPISQSVPPEITETFYTAIEVNDIPKAIRLYNQYPGILMQQNRQGQTPLHIICQHKRYRLLSLYVRNRAIFQEQYPVIDSNGNSALTLTNDDETFKELYLSFQNACQLNTIQERPLMQKNQGYTDRFETILEKEYVVILEDAIKQNLPIDFETALINTNKKLLILLAKERKYQSIRTLALHPNLPVVAFLQSDNENDDTVLHLLVRRFSYIQNNTDENSLKEKKEIKASITAILSRQLHGPKNKEQLTPFQIAVALNCIELMPVFIASGCAIGDPLSLTMAINQPFAEITTLLLDEGADIAQARYVFSPGTDMPFTLLKKIYLELRKICLKMLEKGYKKDCIMEIFKTIIHTEMWKSINNSWLHFACYFNLNEEIESALKENPQAKFQIESNYSPLALYCSWGTSEAIFEQLYDPTLDKPFTLDLRPSKNMSIETSIASDALLARNTLMLMALLKKNPHSLNPIVKMHQFSDNHSEDEAGPATQETHDSNALQIFLMELTAHPESITDEDIALLNLAFDKTSESALRSLNPSSIVYGLCIIDQNDLVERALKMGLSINSPDGSAYQFCKNNKTAELLLKHDSDLNALRQSILQENGLQDFSISHEADLIPFLLNTAKTNLESKNIPTSLAKNKNEDDHENFAASIIIDMNLALFENKKEVCEREVLRKIGTSFKHLDKALKLKLFNTAITLSFNNVVKKIAQLYPGILNEKTKNGILPIHIAALTANINTFELCLNDESKNAPYPIKDLYNVEYITPFQIFCRSADTSSIDTAIDNHKKWGINLNETSKHPNMNSRLTVCDVLLKTNCFNEAINCIFQGGMPTDTLSYLDKSIRLRVEESIKIYRTLSGQN